MFEVHPLLASIARIQAEADGAPATAADVRRTLGSGGRQRARVDYRRTAAVPNRPVIDRGGGNGEAQAYRPSTGQALGDAWAAVLERMGFSSSQRARMRDEAGYLPGVGDVMTAGDAADAYSRGNVLSGAALAALAGIGLIPGAGDAVAGAGRAALRTTGNALRGGPIRAYHGSPHAFDRFELSPRTIGTGEGAQAYGHGLYFAGNEDVARNYREALSGPRSDYQPGPEWDELRNRLSAVDHLGFDTPAEASRAMLRHGDWAERWGLSRAEEANLRPALDAYRQAKYGGQGHMYEVNINADPDSLLDWDRPLDLQPEIAERIASVGLPTHRPDRWYGPERPYNAGFTMWPNNGSFVRQRDGSNVFEYGVGSPWDTAPLGTATTLEEAQRLTPINPAPLGPMELLAAGPREQMVERSHALRDAGIPGIRFLDQGSRGTGQGTSNYVIFDDNIIDIMRRYGLAAPVVGTGGIMALQDHEDYWQ